MGENLKCLDSVFAQIIVDDKTLIGGFGKAGAQATLRKLSKPISLHLLSMIRRIFNLFEVRLSGIFSQIKITAIYTSLQQLYVGRRLSQHYQSPEDRENIL